MRATQSPSRPPPVRHRPGRNPAGVLRFDRKESGEVRERFDEHHEVAAAFAARTLDFTITECTVPEPYTVKWKVLNRGDEAEWRSLAGRSSVPTATATGAMKGPTSEADTTLSAMSSRTVGWSRVITSTCRLPRSRRADGRFRLCELWNCAAANTVPTCTGYRGCDLRRSPDVSYRGRPKDHAGTTRYARC